MEIGKKLGINEAAVANIVQNKLNLDRKKDYRISEKDLEFITQNYLTMEHEDIGKQIGKTRAAVQLILSKRKLKKREFWTEKETQFLKENYQLLPTRELASQLNKTKRAVEHARNNLGLSGLKNTNIELLVEEFFKSEKLDYKCQVKIWKYRVDFIIDKLIIEAYGSYWHCDPRLYPDGPKYTSQKDCVRRDALRIPYLQSKGYHILILWEKDIHENFERVKQLILASYNRAKSVEVSTRDNTEVITSIA